MTPEVPMVPRGAEEAQNGARSGPKRPQEELKKAKKATPNDKTKNEPNQVDPKTVLDRLRADLPSSAAPPGSIWEAKSGPKPIPKRSKFEAIIEEEKTSIQDDLGPVLERSWVVVGRHVEAKSTNSSGKRNILLKNTFSHKKICFPMLLQFVAPT